MRYFLFGPIMLAKMRCRESESRRHRLSWSFLCVCVCCVSMLMSPVTAVCACVCVFPWDQASEQLSVISRVHYKKNRINTKQTKNTLKRTQAILSLGSSNPSKTVYTKTQSVVPSIIIYHTYLQTCVRRINTSARTHAHTVEVLNIKMRKRQKQNTHKHTIECSCARLSPNARTLSIFRWAHRKAHAHTWPNAGRAVCVIYESEQALTLHIRLSNKNDDHGGARNYGRTQPIQAVSTGRIRSNPNNPSNCLTEFIGGGRAGTHA